MTVTGVGTTTETYSTAQTREIKTELDKDSFLRILVVQLTNQDPLEPLKDTEFIAQMAQFSELEQMMNISKQLDNLTMLSLLSSGGLVGRTVSFFDEAGEEVSSRVLSVRFGDGDVTLELASGKGIPLGAILSIS
ncbi:MAG: Flagellar hook capping protein [Synergistales bacterium 54_24]|jgi:flagellar basal-body rod modification protein FlgD|nr:MAG: Flagellar hook capping protein [Synergistales bacterium 54_24]HAF49529.1 flagellar hook assembly protein FlgD [Synergistaceae bacterium]